MNNKITAKINNSIQYISQNDTLILNSYTNLQCNSSYHSQRNL